MIYIEQHSHIPEQNNARVASPTREYEDTALIAFYDVSNPDLEIGSYQAQYVKYGSLVYRFNDPRELGQAILNIDPQSTHSAATFVRSTDELLLKMNGDTLATEVPEVKKLKIVPSEDIVDDHISTTTPATIKRPRPSSNVKTPVVETRTTVRGTTR